MKLVRSRLKLYYVYPKLYSFLGVLGHPVLNHVYFSIKIVHAKQHLLRSFKEFVIPRWSVPAKEELLMAIVPQDLVYAVFLSKFISMLIFR